ncbi:MAG: cytochrome c3 family protein, partial [Candidatus Latescibacterota bacterium]
ERNPHTENGVGCTACHGIHGNVRTGLLKKREVELCYDCHTDVRGQFAQPYRHPVWDQIVRCSDCHMALAENKGLLSYSRMDQDCFRCHAYFRGPFPFEHQATIGWSTQEGGCSTCHNAHGSSIPRMLKQPYESPDFSLCSQCHSVPGHNYNSRHGDEWAGVACNECHVDIHGSYVSQYFFSSSMQTQGCFNVGCHQF